MKAIVFDRYGPPDVLQFEEVEKPVPKANEVLVKIHAATVTAGDCEMRRFDVAPLFWVPLRLYMGVRKPRIQILGQELAGEIESVGQDVTRFNPGDQIIAATDINMGAYAEYVCLKEDGTLCIKPSSIAWSEAAAIPTGGLNALHFLKRANIKPGEAVLIIGAGGSIGTCGIQLAKHFGAEVTAVDSTEKLDMLHSIGADHVIDYTQEDFNTNSQTYDVIFDVIGKGSLSRTLGSLIPSGRYLAANPGVSTFARALWTSLAGDKKVITGLANYPPEDIHFLTELIESGELNIVIDRVYPFERTAEAHQYVEAGHKKGNVVISVMQDRE